jgi:DNA-binding transcriptional LysR family regulator
VVIWFGALPDVQWRPFPLGRAENVLCAAPAVAASLDGLAPTELGRARTVLYSRSVGAPSWRLGRDGETLDVAIDPWLRTNDVDSALAAVLNGHGVASLPGVLVTPHLQAGRLVRVLPGWRVELGPITALYRPSSRSPAAVQTFLTKVRHAVAAAQSPDSSQETPS